MHSAEEIADAISRGHAYDHVEKGEFSDHKKKRGHTLPVHDRTSYKAHILKTLKSRDTVCFERKGNGACFYNKRTNTFIGYDPNSKDLGSCYRPTSKFRHMKNKYKDARKDRLDGQTSRRGYDDLKNKMDMQRDKERTGNATQNTGNTKKPTNESKKAEPENKQKRLSGGDLRKQEREAQGRGRTGRVGRAGRTKGRGDREIE